jgi:hypothetical protein
MRFSTAAVLAFVAGSQLEDASAFSLTIGKHQKLGQLVVSPTHAKIDSALASYASTVSYADQERIAQNEFPGPIPQNKRFVTRGVGPRQTNYVTSRPTWRTNENENKADLNGMPGPIPVGGTGSRRGVYRDGGVRVGGSSFSNNYFNGYGSGYSNSYSNSNGYNNGYSNGLFNDPMNGYYDGYSSSSSYGSGVYGSGGGYGGTSTTNGVNYAGSYSGVNYGGVSRSSSIYSPLSQNWGNSYNSNNNWNSNSYGSYDRSNVEDMQRRLQDTMDRLREMERIADEARMEASDLRNRLDNKEVDESEAKSSSRELFQELMETLNYNKELKQQFSSLLIERDHLREEVDDAYNRARQSEAYVGNPQGYAGDRIRELENSLRVERNDRQSAEQELVRSQEELISRNDELRRVEDELSVVRNSEDVALSQLSVVRNDALRVEQENRRLVVELQDTAEALEQRSREFTDAFRDISEVRNTMRNMLQRMGDFNTELSYQLQKLDDIELEYPNYSGGYSSSSYRSTGNYDSFSNDYVTYSGSDSRYGRRSNPYSRWMVKDDHLMNPFDRVRTAFRN